MSDDPDPPFGGKDPEPDGKVARLHPPGMPHHAALDRAVQAQIGAQLRTMYEHYVDQPIPDRLIDLVRRLGEAQTAGAAKGEASPGGGTAASASSPGGEARAARDAKSGSPAARRSTEEEPR